MPESRKPRPARSAVLAVLLAVLGIVAGCGIGPSSRPDLAVYGGSTGGAGDATETSRPTGPGGPGRTGRLEGDWTTCQRQDPVTGRAATFTLSCNSLRVPLNHEDENGTQLRLHLGRAAAPGLAVNAPPLVVLMGNGPFDASLGNVQRLRTIAATLPESITSRYAIVGLDVRGAGQSQPVNCFRRLQPEVLFTINADLTTDQARTHLSDVARDFVFGCQDAIDANMIYYSGTQAADDLDALRSALAQDTLSLVASGSGATVGGVYVDRYPGRVGRIVLDAPIDHAITPSERALQQAPQLERALRAFAADCTSKPSCPLGADPVASINALIRSFDYAATMDDDNPNSGAVLWALLFGLPDQQRWPDLVTTLAAASSRESAIGNYLDDAQDASGAAIGPALIHACNDSDQRISGNDLETVTEQAATAAPIFGSFLVGLSALCRQWPAPESTLGALRGQGAAPVVVIGGVDDPASPLAGTQAVSKQLSSAVLVSYAGVGHGGYPRSPCVTELVNAYLLDGTVPPAGTLCAG